MITVEEAVALAGVSSRAIHRLAEARQIHFRETPEGRCSSAWMRFGYGLTSYSILTLMLRRFRAWRLNKQKQEATAPDNNLLVRRALSTQKLDRAIIPLGEQKDEH